MRLIRLFRDALLAAPDGRLPARLLLNSVLASGGSMLLAGAALGVSVLAGIPFEEIEVPERAIGVWDFIGVAVLAPLIETPLLIALLALLPARMGIVPRAAVSALVWGGLHALIAPFWFFGVVWAFFVFSCGYLVWRPESFRHGFAAAALPHALQNLAAYAMLLISS